MITFYFFFSNISKNFLNYNNNINKKKLKNYNKKVIMEKKQEKEKIEDDKNSNFPRTKTYSTPLNLNGNKLN